MCEQRKFIDRRRSRIGHERCCISLARLGDLGNVLHKISSEAVLHVADSRSAQGMTPAHVPGNFSIHFRSIHQCIDHIVIVLYVNVTGLECRSSGSKVY